MRALFVLIVMALAVGRWEVAAADLFEAVKGVAFGIRIGDFTISFGAVFGAIALFLVIVGLTRLLQRWLEAEVMPHTAIEPSLQLSIVTILGYVGFIVAIVVALGEIGIDPQKIALVAGALSVGIGFGLQSIVSNFVSGLILLAERPIRVGDQIVVKGDEGFVRRISVRATEIETFDRASVIIPNSELITGVVKNWTHANTLGRLNIKVAVSYECDAEKVIEILNACVGGASGGAEAAAARRAAHRVRRERADVRDLLHRAEPRRARPHQERHPRRDPARVPRRRDRHDAAAGRAAAGRLVSGSEKLLIFRPIFAAFIFQLPFRGVIAAGIFSTGTTDDRHADRRMCAAHRRRAGAARLFRLRQRGAAAARASRASTATSRRAGSSIRRPRSR